jgi:hypothetical protein
MIIITDKELKLLPTFQFTEVIHQCLHISIVVLGVLICRSEPRLVALGGKAFDLNAAIGNG